MWWLVILWHDYNVLHKFVHFKAFFIFLLDWNSREAPVVVGGQTNWCKLDMGAIQGG